MNDFQPMRLHVSRLKMGLSALLFFLVIVGTLFALMENEYPLRELLFGIAGLLFLSVFFMLYAIQLIPGASWLDLDHEGFTCSYIYKKRRYLWKDVKNFRSESIGWNKMVFFDVLPSHRQNAGALSTKITKLFGGKDAGLSDTYGKGAHALAELMNRWCEKFGGER